MNIDILESFQAAASVGKDQLAPLSKAIAQVLKELRLLARNQQKRINELCDARQAKTWAQIATPKKIAQATGLDKTEVIIVPNFRETEIKERAGLFSPALRAFLGTFDNPTSWERKSD